MQSLVSENLAAEISLLTTPLNSAASTDINHCSMKLGPVALDTRQDGLSLLIVTICTSSFDGTFRLFYPSVPRLDITLPGSQMFRFSMSLEVHSETLLQIFVL